MNKDIELEINEDESSAVHYVKVNGVRLHIFQHECGAVNMMIHGLNENVEISMCDVKVSKKTVWCGKTRWVDIEVVE